MSNNTIEVNGRSIEYEQKLIDIYEVDYYLENPRINYIISKYPTEEVNSALIQRTLLALDSTKDLEQDIFDNKGLIEAIVVMDGKVIEGNTRLCCYRRLHERTKDDYWKFIKSNIIIDSLSTEEIFAILSNYHIKGKKPWDLYEKAAYINKMIESGKNLDDIAKTIGSTRNKVENMLKAYKVMRDKYLKKIQPEIGNGEVKEVLRKFSYFEAFYINKNLAERAEQTPQFMDEFVEWVAEGRIPKAQDVRQLHNILDYKKSRKAFIENEPEDAFLEANYELNWNRPDKIDGFYKKVSQFKDVLRQADINKVKEEVSTNTNMKNAIKTCFKDFQKFCKEIDLN